ncbi:glycosyltransferase family 2 protein [Rhodovulum sp. PH10]|uniref:glycosyltransferase family 2 protein n=1 Tax=Rhodovulum sp. PH10 TaxID=1187851 RepID=UPI0009FC6593|nr:glycosyltransferase family 2 protein [Rhodovulum sp. PH10]
MLEVGDRAGTVRAVGGPCKLPITAIILAFNEEIHIERCLSRILPLAERVIVIDSFSTDRTVEIARAMGAEVLQHAWKNYSDQFQWGIDNARPTTSWTMRLDADEYLEDRAHAELRLRFDALPEDVTGLTFKLKVIFRGRWIRHGRYYSTILLRLWRTGVGQIEQRWMDEHIVLSHGRTEHIAGGDLVDHNLNDIGWWIDKHNRYSTRHMIDYVNRTYRLFAEDRRIHDTAAAARRKRFMKNNVYGRAPIYLRATLFYLYRYIIRAGFLDGKEGFVFHFMHGFWMMMLIDAKIDEARSFIKAHGVDAFRAHVKARHGLEV